MSKNNQKETKALLEAIVKGIQEKKGENITLIDLKETGNSVCDFFVICSANSNTQVEAITQSVEEFTEKILNENPRFIEGKRNAYWVLMDYFNVLVHIFYKETRDQFGLERLWADGKISKIEAVS